MGGFICGPKIYKWRRKVFEYHEYLGPYPLRKDTLEPFKRMPGPKFWEFIAKFEKLTKEQQEKYLIGGGCLPIK